MDNYTWTLVPHPVIKNVVVCRWVYKIKYNSDGSVERYKARFTCDNLSVSYIPLSLLMCVIFIRHCMVFDKLLVLGFIGLAVFFSEVASYRLRLIAPCLFFVVIPNSHILLSSFISVLSSEFAMKDLGDIPYFLGIQTPRIPHFLAVQRIYRYLQGISSFGIFLRPSDISGLVAYSDADWADCPDSAHSTTGFAIYLGSNLISWQAKKHPTVSKSSTETEYRAVACTVADTLWIRSLLAELGFPIVMPVRLFSDDVSASYLVLNPEPSEADYRSLLIVVLKQAADDGKRKLP
ncbi:Retrovirus-related Pol polyprotein from transposon RE1-like protein, partial [Drosera capensis]